ncbi:hypothetical protein [Thermodesulfovibrio yellowstonii]|uniref:hypothetical protein n=1 Tax=Thermodesulfovibrio yellowstonii TaxID=28262 RepID=UPI0024B3AE8B|nr:hypothetical protein [Thermodesulfovibrio yellowstonii]MDI6865552.1 hypothetical protein [Thermodesulfovibrio yellowstonii]
MLFLITIGKFAMAQQFEESYDLNTEITIKGKIAEVIQRQHGPIVIGILKQDKIYHVLTAPAWYIEQEKIELKLGDEVVVHGAKFFSKNGELFLIARSIHNISNGKIYSFRDEFMKPCWRGKGNRKFIPQ